MENQTERKFQTCVQQQHPCKPVPCCPVPPIHMCPHPPGRAFEDCIKYINSYVDMRARQIYEKLKKLIPSGGGGVQSVTFEPSADLGNDPKPIGTLVVDDEQTDVLAPSVNIEARTKESFYNPVEQPILIFKGIGENGQDVNVYCESPDGVVLPGVKLMDRVNGKLYSLYMEDGELMSREIINTTDAEQEP